MNRLTKKNNGTGSWTQFGDKYLPAHNIKHKQCVNKLGQLEDILEKYGIENLTNLDVILAKNFAEEEIVRWYNSTTKELGVELTTLFKALRDGVFINDDGSVYKDYIKSIEHWPDCWGFISNDEEIEVFFEDYGVTWALTSEELEKDEDE